MKNYIFLIIVSLCFFKLSFSGEELAKPMANPQLTECFNECSRKDSQRDCYNNCDRCVGCKPNEVLKCYEACESIQASCSQECRKKFEN